MSDGKCIFCRIVAGELPSEKVYEDADVIAFMDISPVVRGHTLVVPKAHHPDIAAAPVPALQKVIAVVKKVAQAQLQALRADGVNVTQANGEAAGQVVPHIHFHVIPRFRDDGHSWTSPQRKYGDAAEMKTFAQKIRQGLDA